MDDQSVPRRSRRPWRAEKYQPYRRWKFSAVVDGLFPEHRVWWPRWSHNPWRAAEYQPYRGNSANGSGDPGTLPRRDDGTQDPHTINDWTAQVRAPAANPAWAQEQFAQWQLLHQQYQHLQHQQQLVASSTTIFGKCFPRTGGVWTRERIGLVCNRPIQHNARVRKHESSTGQVW